MLDIRNDSDRLSINPLQRNVLCRFEILGIDDKTAPGSPTFGPATLTLKFDSSHTDLFKERGHVLINNI